MQRPAIADQHRKARGAQIQEHHQLPTPEHTPRKSYRQTQTTVTTNHARYGVTLPERFSQHPEDPQLDGEDQQPLTPAPATQANKTNKLNRRRRRRLRIWQNEQQLVDAIDQDDLRHQHSTTQCGTPTHEGPMTTNEKPTSRDQAPHQLIEEAQREAPPTLPTQDTQIAPNNNTSPTHRWNKTGLKAHFTNVIKRNPGATPGAGSP